MRLPGHIAYRRYTVKSILFWDYANTLDKVDAGMYKCQGNYTPSSLLYFAAAGSGSQEGNMLP